MDLIEIIGGALVAFFSIVLIWPSGKPRPTSSNPVQPQVSGHDDLMTLLAVFGVGAGLFLLAYAFS